MPRRWFHKKTYRKRLHIIHIWIHLPNCMFLFHILYLHPDAPHKYVYKNIRVYVCVCVCVWGRVCVYISGHADSTEFPDSFAILPYHPFFLTGALDCIHFPHWASVCMTTCWSVNNGWFLFRSPWENAQQCPTYPVPLTWMVCVIEGTIYQPLRSGRIWHKVNF